MSDKPLWQMSASELAGLTRAGAVSAEEAARAAVERMRAVNPALNAVVADLGDEAIARARALDAGRGSGAVPGPLHGVPVTIKINVDQKGHASSNGLPALKDFIAPDDAPLVRSLQAAGAVVIGRSNTPEFSYRADTDNPLFGRTHNPWGRHLSAGGSSGGAGAAVMAGMGALAHGNDIAGSLRFPTMANGAVTVKPGLGRVPAWNPSQKAERGLMSQLMSVQGLIARQARDLHLAMPVIIAPDARDPFHAPVPWRGEGPEGPLRIGFTTECFGMDLHPENAAALQAAREALVDAGHIVEEIAPPDIRAAGNEAFRVLMTEVSLLLRGDIEQLGSPAIVALFDDYCREFPPLEPAEFQYFAAQRTWHARAWSQLLERHPLVITPFMPQPVFAPDADLQVDQVLGRAAWSYAINFIGQPAGYVSTGLAELPEGPSPTGVQIVGRRWREDLIVDAMAAIEDRLGTLSERLWERMG